MPSINISSKRSRRCWLSSSTTSASRIGSRLRDAIAARISFDQSGILGLRDATDCVDKIEPGRALRFQHFLSLSGQLVIAATALAGLLYPSPCNPSALFEPVEQGIKRGDVELQYTLGALFDELADLVTVACA